MSKKRSYLNLAHYTWPSESVTMSKRKRTDLSLADRYEVVKLLDQKTPEVELSRKIGVSTSQICRINGKKEEICQQYKTNANPERKRQRTGKAGDVETALKTWFQDARTCDILISGPVLEEKAKDLAQALQNTDFVPMHSWLARWKARNQIVYKRQLSKKKDPDHASADHWTTNVLPELLHTYDPDDIYNADKTGIYYCALPDGTLTEKTTEISSSKKLKDRITALVSCNMIGTNADN